MFENMDRDQTIGDITQRPESEEFCYLPLDLIDPDPAQPRVVFDPGELEALADTIRVRQVASSFSWPWLGLPPMIQLPSSAQVSTQASPSFCATASAYRVTSLRIASSSATLLSSAPSISMTILPSKSRLSPRQNATLPEGFAERNGKDKANDHP